MIGISSLQRMRALLGTTFVLAAGSAAAQAAPADPAAFVPRPAVRSSFAERSMILDATRAGARLVAVGERGVVLLSDDEGGTWRQAAMVPADATLTAVSFADARLGWAVGHQGVILHTADGGESWSVQRTDTAEDRPLFSVHFTDARHGVAVGLWSLMLRTHDGGARWEALEPPPPPGDTRVDANLMSIFGNAQGDLFVAAERGLVLRSRDGGDTWSYHPTGYRGTFLERRCACRRHADRRRPARQRLSQHRRGRDLAACRHGFAELGHRHRGGRWPRACGRPGRRHPG